MNFLNAVNRTKLRVRSHSPEILIIAGVVGVVASAIMACKATIKASEVVEEHKKEMELVREECIQEKEKIEETARTYTKTSIKLVKIYGPSIALGVLSLGCVIYSNNILRKRNAALAAAYMVIDKSFKEYRSRVIERFGEEAEYKIRHNIKELEIEEKTVDSKGKEKTVKKKVDVIQPGNSDYVKYFVKGNVNWSNNPDMNECFLRMAQENANQKLMAKGSISLNEVYDLLGFYPTKAGLVVGWIYDPKNPTGDNQVILDIKEERLANEYGGFEWGYAVDFNVDGNIFNMMK